MTPGDLGSLGEIGEGLDTDDYVGFRLPQDDDDEEETSYPATLTLAGSRK